MTALSVFLPHDFCSARDADELHPVCVEMLCELAS